MDNAKAFNTADALRFGWQQTRANLKSLLPIALLAAFLALLLQALRSPADGRHMILSLLIQLLQVGVTLIWINASLRVHDGQKLDWQLLFEGLDDYFTFLLTMVLCGLIVAGGMILLVVPGVIWAIKYGFAGFAVVDRQLDPLAALRESARITSGQKGRLFVFGLALFGINLLGAVALGIGLFVTIPTSYIAAAYVYRRLEVRAGASGQLDLGAPAPAH